MKNHQFTKDVLKLDPEKEDLESQEELISYLYDQASTQDYKPEDVDLLLTEALAGGDAELLGDQYSGSDSTKSRAAWPLLVLLVVSGAGLVWFIIAWWRRREKREKQGD